EDGRLMGLGRGDNIDGRMPMSISDDMGETWTYSASEFPPIASGQRLVLTRLREGPILFVSFTDTRGGDREGMLFPDAEGDAFRGYGLFAALSYDEGATWPVRKLVTPGAGEYDGGAHHGHFEATPTNAEHGGYLAATQTPDGVIHLISSRLHYRFNMEWLETPAAPVDTE
ncbi:MAG: sialidase family protein, partial [Candidatus Hydrogenedentota bacterium]